MPPSRGRDSRSIPKASLTARRRRERTAQRAPQEGIGTIFVRRWNPWLGAALLALALLVSYLPAIRGGFIWDDNLLISQNPLVTGTGGPWPIWVSKQSMDYTPLTITSFWVEWRLWNANPMGYHLVNLLLATGSAVLIWRILKKLEIPGAWLGALLFAIHPVNVASIAWIAERKNTLSLFFYLLALFWFLDFQKERKWPAYGLAFIAAACAFLSKGSTVILPGVMLGCVWWRERKVTGRDLLATGPFFALAAAFALVTIRYQAQIVTPSLARASLAYRIVRAGEAVCFYVWKDALPLGLCPIYPKWPINPRSVIEWLPALAVAGTTALLLWKRNSWGRPFLFAWGYFLLGLLPVLGFVSMGFLYQSHVTDWWQELAMIGLMAMAGAGVATGLRKLGKEGRAALTISVAAVAIWLGCRTWSEAANYASPDAYWEHELAYNPDSWQAHSNFGDALSAEGHADEAIAEDRKALSLSQQYALPFYDLANDLRKKGRLDEAIYNYQQALRLRPAYPDALINLGVALKAEGKLDDAIGLYRKALGFDADSSSAHDNLGVALAQEGRLDEAIAEYQAGLRLNPDNRVARLNLENAMSAREGLNGAMARAREILKAHSNDAATYEDVASEMIQNHLYGRAAAILDEAIGRHPDDAHLRADFAWLLATCPDAEVRNGAKAEELAAQANAMTGNDPTIVNPLAVAYAEEGRFPEALTTAREALRLARQTSNKDLSDLIGREIASFSAGKAFVDQ